MRKAVPYLLLGSLVLMVGTVQGETVTQAELPSCWYLDAVGCVDFANDSFPALMEKVSAVVTRPKGISKWNEPDRAAATGELRTEAAQTDEHNTVSLLQDGDPILHQDETTIKAVVLAGCRADWQATMAQGL